MCVPAGATDGYTISMMREMAPAERARGRGAARQVESLHDVFLYTS